VFYQTLRRLTVEIKAKDNLLEGIPDAGLADNEQTDSVRSKYTSDEDAAMAIAKQHGIQFVRLSEEEPSLSWVRLLPQWLATKHNVIAVKLEKDTLYVAMANPLDLPTLDQINLVTGYKVKPMVATEKDIIRAIKQRYGAQEMSRQDLVDARLSHMQSGQVSEKNEDLSVLGEAGRVVRLINSTIKDAIDSTASDIHFEPSEGEIVVRFRVDGILHDCLTVPASMKNEITSRLKILAKLDITERRKAQDGHIDLKYKGNDYDLRVSVVPTIDGEKTVLRILDKNSIINLTTLGLDAEEMELIREAASRPYGMLLITGPTGSGKTTTLYAVLQGLDAIGKNIITIENPVEYHLDRINQIQIDPETGETFAGVLRSILRQDPDIIMLGEIRDIETSEIAVQAALTGHLVLSTLHTNDAVTAITRLRELGIPSFLISSCVVMAGAQRLVRKICPDCKETYQPDKKTLKLLGVNEPPAGGFVHGKGCHYCYETGFRGREGVFEILKIDIDIQNAILAEKSALEIKKMAVEKGMKTLLDSALLKVSQGKTTVEEVKRVIAPERF
jgi:type II secretory ATPase GspE/PulE/Tfp pilus assembly ATPase PilB-like protein